MTVYTKEDGYLVSTKTIQVVETRSKEELLYERKILLSEKEQVEKEIAEKDALLAECEKLGL